MSNYYPGKLQMESNNKRRARKGNFSHPEVQFLVDMIASRKHIIENKRTDSVTNSEKTKAWAEICTVFNAYSPNCYRDVKSLRSKYDQLKMDAKRKMAQMKWPGQSCGIEFLPHEDKIVSMLTGVMEGEYMSDEHSYMGELKTLPFILINYLLKWQGYSSYISNKSSKYFFCKIVIQQK